MDAVLGIPAGRPRRDGWPDAHKDLHARRVVHECGAARRAAGRASCWRLHGQQQASMPLPPPPAPPPPLVCAICAMALHMNEWHRTPPTSPARLPAAYAAPTHHRVLPLQTHACVPALLSLCLPSAWRLHTQGLLQTGPPGSCGSHRPVAECSLCSECNETGVGWLPPAP